MEQENKEFEFLPSVIILINNESKKEMWFSMESNKKNIGVGFYSEGPDASMKNLVKYYKTWRKNNPTCNAIILLNETKDSISEKSENIQPVIFYRERSFTEDEKMEFLTLLNSIE